MKGWVDPASGQTAETVYEVSGDPNSGAAVDPATCAQTGPGSAQLCTTWTDPDFKASEREFYYVRALENPSCSHEAYDCQTLASGDAGALPPQCSSAAKTTLQERAWSSPIWYSRR